jgi:hypothetical protein
MQISPPSHRRPAIIRRKVMAGESTFDVGLLSKEFSENNNWY